MWNDVRIKDGASTFVHVRNDEIIDTTVETMVANLNYTLHVAEYTYTYTGEYIERLPFVCVYVMMMILGV